MKKAIYKIIPPFLVLFLLFNLSGCDNKETGDNKETDVRKCICGNTAGFFEADYMLQPLKYKTFEEYLLEADEIVYATYTGECEDVYVHTPLIKKELKKREECFHSNAEDYLIMESPQIKGNTLENSFKVQVVDYDFSVENENGIIDHLVFDQSKRRWEQGKTYILLLKKMDTGEDDGIKKFTMISDAVIPTDGGTPTMYSEPLEKHSTGYDGEGSIEGYIREFLKNNSGK